MVQTSPYKKVCLKHNRNRKSGSASVADMVAYFLKFQYLTDMYVTIRKSMAKKSKSNSLTNAEELYQNYLDNDNEVNCDVHSNITFTEKQNGAVNNVIEDCQFQNKEDSYCSYLEKTIFGPVAMQMKKENIIIKRNNKGLVAKLVTLDEKKQPSDEIIEHNLQKLHFYEQDPECATLKDIFVS